MVKIKDSGLESWGGIWFYHCLTMCPKRQRISQCLNSLIYYIGIIIISPS